MDHADPRLESRTHPFHYPIRRSDANPLTHPPFTQKSGHALAIGHAADFDFSAEDISTNFNPENLSIYLTKYRNEINEPLSKGTVTKLLTQITTFIKDIQIDDWVITLNSSTVYLGKITSNTYYSKEPIYIRQDAPSENPPDPLDFSLRRNVKWAYRFSRAKLPSKLQFTFGAHQTVFNVDYYKHTLYHLVYPAFLDNHSLYFGVHVTQEDAISAVSMARYFNTIIEIEAASKYIAEGHKIDDVNLSKIADTYEEEGGIDLSSKAEYSSPGFIWFCIGLSILSVSALPYFLVIYGRKHGITITDLELFNIFKIGKLEIHGKIPSQAAIRDMAEDARQNAEKVVASTPSKPIIDLGIRLPSVNPKAITAQQDEEPAENIDDGDLQ